MSNIILEIKNINKSFGKKQALTDVSLSIKEGEVFGLLGGNGDGKTTVIKSILNLIHIDKGQINIFNHNIDREFSKIIKFIGYIPNENSIYKNMKVIDFLIFSNSFYEASYIENINYYLDEFILDKEKKINDLTDCEQRKLSIINAIYHEPQLLLIDDIVDFLDSKTSFILNKILIELKRKGTSILYASHDLPTLRSIADNISIIRNGKILDYNINDLKQSYKLVSIMINGTYDSKKLDDKDIKILNNEDNIISFIYKGKIDNLIKKLCNFDILDIEITNPSLEEFLSDKNEQKTTN